MKNRVLAVGHSHLGALQFYSSLHAGKLDFQIDFVQMLSNDFDPGTIPDADLRLAQVLRGKAALCDLAVLCISGNEHQIIGLVNHPRPFDFVSPVEPDLPLLIDREIVPGEIVNDTLASMMRGDLFKLVAENVPIPKYQLEPPPSILDHGYINAHAGQFKEKFSELGINDPIVRRKLWRLSSELTRSLCGQYSIDYMPVPSAAIGPEGFLHCDALGGDATHANAWYGGLLIGQISDLLRQRVAHG